MEDEKDAIDMGNEEMEGDLGSVDGAEDEDGEGSRSGDDNEEDDELDEEVGDVDDLDPTAVDEKMWDGDGEEAEKEQQGDKQKGQKKDDEVTAADGTADAEDDHQEAAADEEVGPEHEEAVPYDELNKQDENVQQDDVLALPDDMDIDVEDEAMSSDGEDDLDNLSDADQDEQRKEVWTRRTTRAMTMLKKKLSHKRRRECKTPPIQKLLRKPKISLQKMMVWSWTRRMAKRLGTTSKKKKGPRCHPPKMALQRTKSPRVRCRKAEDKPRKKKLTPKPTT